MLEPADTLIDLPRLGALGHLAQVALTATTHAEIFDALADALHTALAADQVHVLQLTADDVAHGFVRIAGRADEHYVQPLDVTSGVGAVVTTREPLLIGDAAACPTLRQDHVARWNVRSALLTPLEWTDAVQVVAAVVSHRPEAFGSDAVDLAMILSRTAAGGLARLTLQRHVHGRAERHAAIARAARSLNESLDLATVLEALCREADLAVGGDFAGVYLIDASGDGVAMAGHDTPEHWRGLVLPAGVGAGGRALATGQPAVVSDYDAEVGVPPNPHLDRTKVASAVPMRWGGELRGALSVGWHSVRRITDTDIEVLEAIAELAAVACQNAEAYGQAQQAARTDSLTGVLNHGAMQAGVREAIVRARRECAPLSCLLIDIDAFKSLNDRAGHQVGDQVLRAAAQALAAEVRPHGQVARYGGDEFAVILPGVDAEGARVIAERARHAVAVAANGVVASDALSASVGLAEWHEPWTATELLARADRALLRAKRRGRDRVELCTPELDDELALGDSDTELTRAFWDMVASAEHPRDSLVALPTLLRRHLRMEEVALYVAEPERAGTLARRSASTWSGDPSLRAFGGETLVLGEATWQRLAGGPLSRRSIGELWEALQMTGADPDELPGSYAAVPLLRAGRPLGMLVLRASERDFPADGLRSAYALAGQAVVALLGRVGGGSPAAVTALAAAIDARDHYTHAHSEEVVALACEVARDLGLSAGEVERIRHGALLHDVGKVAIANEILLKPGPLDDDEWAEMRRHPEIGEGILRQVPELLDIAPLVRHEHERWDGCGYPDGLSARAIPIGSRIILGCDAYNAMITRRPYREPMSDAEATAELRRCAGTQFDPEVVEALLRVLDVRRA